MRLSVLLRTACAALMLAGVFVSAPIATQALAASTSTGCLPGALKRKLSQIRSKFGPVRVISTHRPGARIAGSGKRSLHSACRAVDFHPPRGQYRAVVAWLKANHGGGVGTYSCGMHHIHMDNGPRVRFHHCVGRSGRPRRSYASRRARKPRYAARRQQRRARSNGRPRIVRSQETSGAPRTTTAGGTQLKAPRYLRRLTQNGA